MRKLGNKTLHYICAFLSVVLIVSIVFKSHAAGQDNIEVTAIKTDLQTKYYQQALYSYFQGNYVVALNVLNESKIRIGSLNDKSRLFEAGLQINIGLKEEARKNLLSLIASQYEIKEKKHAPGSKSFDKNKKDSEQLLVIALLSLAEQYISQGDVSQAKIALTKITNISQQYYQQYHVLNQLAFWPKVPTLIKPSNTYDQNNNIINITNSVEFSPYIQLNNALRLIENSEFNPAILLLKEIKDKGWQAPEKTFFQSLFSDEEIDVLTQLSADEIQNQAVKDYAQLLLAHVYSKQADYEKVFYELKNFPQKSPYLESALFLFAFSAQKVNQHTMALNLLTYLHEQYPFTALGWQASLLMAKQVTEQKGLNLGWQTYEKVERFYLEKLKQLALFEASFEKSTDLLTFSTSENRSTEVLERAIPLTLQTDTLFNTKNYKPNSIWLTQAMYDVSLNSLYQQLSEVSNLHLHSHFLKQKSDWVVHIINLNTKRKMRISLSQNDIVQQGINERLLNKRNEISTLLASALVDPNKKREIFANAKEQKWISRLNKSKDSLAYITSNGKPNASVNNEYQKRLTRIEGVLSWQLTKDYPQREWEHKQALAALDDSLKNVEKLQNKISALTKASPNIDNLKDKNGNRFLLYFLERHQNEDEKINPLIEKLFQTKLAITSKIRNEVSQYVNNQKSILAQHLLTTRKAMAAVLEQMSDNDIKIEKQLNAEEELNLEQGEKLGENVENDKEAK